LTDVRYNIASYEAARAAAVLKALSPEAVSRYVSASVVREFDLPEHIARMAAGPAAAEPPRFSLFEEFLAPEELSELTNYVLARQGHFRTSQVISHARNEGRIDYNHRRSRVLFELGILHDMVSDRLKSYFPQILDSIGHPWFEISSIEAQITASNDGEFFRTHNDNTHAFLVSREVTYVFFFHREPAAFTGGELRIYATRRENGRCVAGDIYTSITPRQNMAVFFPSYLMHEVTIVRCPSRAFADSRFTLNGWIHR
jgi:Rps23 Pro-64 3,4-dihydroxylase Tpa1-like proline 4-hydroxylase